MYGKGAYFALNTNKSNTHFFAWKTRICTFETKEIQTPRIRIAQMNIGLRSLDYMVKQAEWRSRALLAFPKKKRHKTRKVLLQRINKVEISDKRTSILEELSLGKRNQETGVNNDRANGRPSKAQNPIPVNVFPFSYRWIVLDCYDLDCLVFSEKWFVLGFRIIPINLISCSPAVIMVVLGSWLALAIFVSLSFKLHGDFRLTSI